MKQTARIRFKAFALTLWLWLLPGAAHATNYALILTIGEYRNGVTPLRGVKHDVRSAAKMARLMQVKDEHIFVASNAKLTLAGLREVLGNLENAIGDNDRLFLYYSGHGGRHLAPGAGGRCAESLVSVNGEPLLDLELEERLKRIGRKAEKIMVFFDACHSGGVTTRSLQSVSKESEYTPKFWSKAGADTCSNPVNVMTRNLRIAKAKPASDADNYVYIAAARANEVSLDSAKAGGVATRAWLFCMEGRAKDLDGSGGITVEENRRCAQALIDEALGDGERFRPHHITITGNRDMVLLAAGAGAAATAATAAPAPAATATSPQKTLQDIYNRRDARRQVRLITAKPVFRINADDVKFSVSSSHPGYVYLLMVGSDGHTFDMLFPNQLDGENRIQAGQTLALPRAQWALQAHGPPGKNHLLALITDSPRNFGGIGMQAAGPFSSVTATSASASAIQQTTGNSANAGSATCATAAKTRNLTVRRHCSSAYGAALAVVEEVK